MMETSPEGVFRRAESGEEKPKVLIRVAEYVVTTPLEIEVYIAREISIAMPPEIDHAYQDSQQCH